MCSVTLAIFMKEYGFEEQLSIGEQYENELDNYFSQWFYVSPVDMQFQRAGIDRTWESKENKFVYSVEYKADERASQTGNAFVETVSVDIDDKPGWAYSSCSQILVYYLPIDKKVYIASVIQLKFSVPKWRELCSVKDVQNNGYVTKGVIVPLSEFAKCCLWVRDLEGG